MMNSDAVFISVAKTIAIAGIGAIGGGALTLSGWLWVGAEWKGEINARLTILEKHVDKGFERIDKKFDKVDKKMDRNFDLLITEIRALKK